MKVALSGAALAAVLTSGVAMAGDIASARLAEPASPAAVFLYAQKMKLPQPVGKAITPAMLGKAERSSASEVTRAAAPRRLPGDVGAKVLAPVQIVPDTPLAGSAAPAAGARPKAVGQSGLPFSTSRIELMKGEMSAQYPNRAVGRLGFRYKTGNAMCSASLIGPGLLLTAAHCVTEFGSGQFLPDARWAFVPGYYKGRGAYGTFTAQAVFAPRSYVDGTAACFGSVACPNDVALLVLRPNKKKKYPGTATGWLGVGLDGDGFSEYILSYGAPITQLGYPGGLDNGAQMIRNDALGMTASLGDPDAGETPVDATLIGSVLDGGSSGGPWVVNFGIAPDYGSLPKPQMSTPNMVVGVTSWGDATGEYAIAGSSPFTSEVLGEMITEACTKFPAACAK